MYINGKAKFHANGKRMEKNGEKLSKLHGAVDLGMLRASLEPDELCGLLAAFVGLVPPGTLCRPLDLVSEFDWRRVHVEDVVLEWNQAEGLCLVETSME